MTRCIKGRRAASGLALFLFFILFLVVSPCLGAKRIRVECSYVIDGDTIVLDDGRHLRYLGIDAPERARDDRPAEPYSREATELNRRLVQGRSIDIEVPKGRSHDRYGRLLAFVYLPNGKLVQEILVRQGLARACLYGEPTRYTKRLLSAQRSAISRRIGLWSLEPVKPERYYVGNRRSHRFHRPGCKYGRNTSVMNKVVFRDRLDAFRKGYCPCKRCRP